MSATKRQFHLNAFLMTIGHHEAAWRFPESSLTGTSPLASKSSSTTWCLPCASAASSAVNTADERCASTTASRGPPVVTSINHERQARQAERLESTMAQRILGRTGIRVSPVTLGAMMFGGRARPEESHQIIDRALDAGINSIDTANVFGPNARW
jgi:hypothetical protein